jgi:hypothetical protein
MRLREEVRVQQADEVRESVVVSVVRRCREKHNVVGLGGQFLGELITLGLFSLVSAGRRFLGTNTMPWLKRDDGISTKACVTLR